MPLTAGILLGLALLVGCGGATPEILFADAQLFLVEDVETGGAGERLRLFVAVNDGDGIEDIAGLYIVHDESELYWQATPEQWVVVEQEGDSWIGLPDLRPVHGRVFPRGRYRLIVEDGSLQEVEGSFGITAPAVDLDAVEFPALLTEGGSHIVQATGPVVIRVYTRAGRLAVSREVSPGPLGDNFFQETPQESGLQVYLSSSSGEAIRLLSGPFELDR